MAENGDGEQDGPAGVKPTGPNRSTGQASEAKALARRGPFARGPRMRWLHGWQASTP